MSSIEVPKTRDEINNAILESEIYKLAYERGAEEAYKKAREDHLRTFNPIKEQAVEEAVRGFVEFVDEKAQENHKDDLRVLSKVGVSIKEFMQEYAKQYLKYRNENTK